MSGICKVAVTPLWFRNSWGIFSVLRVWVIAWRGSCINKLFIHVACSVCCVGV